MPSRRFTRASIWAACLSLRARAGILMFAFAVLPAVVFGIAVGIADHRAATRDLQAALVSTANATVRDVDGYVGAHRRALSLIAREWLVEGSGDEAERHARLERLRAEYPGFITLLATDGDGTIVAASPRTSQDGVYDFWRGTSVADRAYVQEPRRTLAPYVSDLFRGRGFGADWIFAVAVPIVADGRFLGVIEGSLPPTRFAEHDAAVLGERGMTVAIVDRSGQLVFASPTLGLAVGQPVRDVPWFAGFLSGSGDTTHATGGIPGFDAGLIGLHTAATGGWTVAVFAPASVQTASARRAAWFGAAMVALAALGALVLLPRATSVLTRQIERVAERIRRYRPDAADPEIAFVPRELAPIHESFTALAASLRDAFARQREQLATERALRDEIVHARETIADSERLLRLVLDTVPEAVVVIDRRGGLVLANAAAGALLPGHDAAPFSLWGAEGDTPHESLPSWLARALATGPVDGHAFVRRDAKGAETHHRGAARPLRDGRGEIRGVVGVFRDVTGEKAAQRQLMLSDRMASMGMLAAGVGHEINNPLAAMVTNLELALAALDGPAAEPVRELLRDADLAAARIRAIVRDLKTFARHEADTDGACDLEQVLETSARLAANEVRHRARLVRDFGPRMTVRGGESRLGQVFLNLLVNAAQAMPDGHAAEHTITLRTREGDDGRAVVEVSDTGSGMSEETQRHLFTPFYTTKPAGVGTGLGLAICQRIVQDVGGEITVASTRGVGTTFRIVLPLAEPVAPAPLPCARPAIDVTALPSARGRVLVVDDERLVAAAIRRVLARTHDVVECTRGDDALTRLRAGEDYDVILCDLMMPEMTGMDLHATIATDTPELADRMVFLTGGAFTPAARAFLATPGRRCIEKPFDADVLRDVVDGRVRERRRAMHA